MLAKSYLFQIKNGKVVIGDKLFVPCDRYYPDTARFVVLQESPCAENGHKSVSVLARHMCGKYYGVATGDELPVILSNTLWTESSIAEGPYRIAEEKTLELQGDNIGLFTHQELSAAYHHVNNLNMKTFGDPTYIVVNEYGIPVGDDGHLYI